MFPPRGNHAAAASHWSSAARRYRGDVNQLAAIILVVLLAVPLVIVGVMFVWAAIRDGEEDRALQRRLGIRRRTRLGR
jgi:hypothetical protein